MPAVTPQEHVERLVSYCEHTLEDPAQWRIPDGYPHGLAMCLLDAIWSLGVHYDRHVVPVLTRYRTLRQAAHADADRDTATALLAVIHQAGGPEAFADLLQNKQRTSTRPGAPLKAAAVEQAAQVFVERGIDTPASLLSEVASDHDELKRKWREIPGQRSSDVGWRYLLLLAGAQEVKADRMVRRFVTEALGGAPVNATRAAELLAAAASRLSVEVRALDHAVWRYQRRRPR